MVEDTTYWLHLGAANYEDIAYVGYTELDVEVDDQTIHKAGILIQEDLTQINLNKKREVPMTLGCNIMNKLIRAKLQEPLKSYIELTLIASQPVTRLMSLWTQRNLRRNKHLPKLTENYQW